LDVAQGVGSPTDGAVRFARGAARGKPWCEVDHRASDWGPRSLTREFEFVNHGRSCDRIDGWVGPNSAPKDQQRALVEATVQEFRNRTRTIRFYLLESGVFHPASGDEPNQFKNEKLHLLSLRSPLDYGHGEGL